MKTHLLLALPALARLALLAPADADAGGTTAPAAEPAAVRNKFTDEQIKEIRELRAEKTAPDDQGATKPVWSHAKLAAKFGTTAGVISQIVRNRTYKDKDYVPVNDGK